MTRQQAEVLALSATHRPVVTRLHHCFEFHGVITATLPSLGCLPVRQVEYRRLNVYANAPVLYALVDDDNEADDWIVL
jgi:hypothetical protein